MRHHGPHTWHFWFCLVEQLHLLLMSESVSDLHRGHSGSGWIHHSSSHDCKSWRRSDGRQPEWFHVHQTQASDTLQNRFYGNLASQNSSGLLCWIHDLLSLDEGWRVKRKKEEHIFFKSWPRNTNASKCFWVAKNNEKLGALFLREVSKYQVVYFTWKNIYLLTEQVWGMFLVTWFSLFLCPQ